MKRFKLKTAAILSLGILFSFLYYYQLKSDTQNHGIISDFSLINELGRHEYLYRNIHFDYIFLFSTDETHKPYFLENSKISSWLKKNNKKTRVFGIDSSTESFPGIKNKDLSIAPESINVTYLYDHSQITSKDLGFDSNGDFVIVRTSDWRVIKKGKSDTYSNKIIWKPVGSLDYDKNIVPILTKHCMYCHFQDGPAPWAMTDHLKVSSWASMMREVIVNHRMPPRIFDPIGHKLRDKEFYGLSPRDKKTLVSWIDNGAKRRAIKNDPLKIAHDKFIKKLKGWPLGEPDLIIDIDSERPVPETGWVDLDSTVVDLKNKIKGHKWIKNMYFKPSAAQSVHDVTLWTSVNSKYQRKSMTYPFKHSWLENDIVQQLIARDQLSKNSDLWHLHKGRYNKNDLDYSARINSTEKNSTLIGFYSPGIISMETPFGTARYIDEDTKFSILMHYKTIGTKIKDFTQVGIYFDNSKTANQALLTGSIQTNSIFFTKNEKPKTYTGYYVVEHDMYLHGIGPHMHYRGTGQDLGVYFPNGSYEIIFSMTNYQYIFVNYYYFEKPIFIPKGSVFKTTGWFDNSKSNPYTPNKDIDVGFGFQPYDEMFWAGLLYTLGPVPQNVSAAKPSNN